MDQFQILMRVATAIEVIRRGFNHDELNELLKPAYEFTLARAQAETKVEPDVVVAAARKLTEAALWIKKADDSGEDADHLNSLVPLIYQWA